MLIAVVLLGLCQLLALVLVLLVVRRWLRSWLAELRDQANTELVKLVNGEPCQTAAVLNAAGRVIGSEAGRSAKASLMADLSHVKRAQNADAADQQLSLVEDHAPGIGGVLANMGPRSRGKLMANPLVQLAVQAFLGGGFGRSPAPTGDNGNSTAGQSVRDRLRKGG